MTDRPIIFSAPMVRALLDGRKTQTRRKFELPANSGRMKLSATPNIRECKWQRGDRLWVREAHAFDSVLVRYYATDDVHDLRKKRSPIHMPRWASRLTLLVTDVRVQRLQEISRGDAMEEGCPFANMADGPNPRDWYRDIWNSIHGPDAWDANPWVAALTFTVHRQNIGQMEPTK